MNMDEIVYDKYKINNISDFEIITPRGEQEMYITTPKNNNQNSRDKKVKGFQNSRRSSKFQSIEEIK